MADTGFGPNFALFVPTTFKIPECIGLQQIAFDLKPNLPTVIYLHGQACMKLDKLHYT